MIQAAMGQEISRLRVSIEPEHIYPYTDMIPRSK